jgi:hypothetical protein
MSPYRDQLILKGGLLLAVLDARRATQDADLLALSIDNDRQAVAERIVQICQTELMEDDGVSFISDSLNSSIIREHDLYSGVRIEMDANIARARVKLKLDINVGDPSLRRRPISAIQLCETDRAFISWAIPWRLCWRKRYALRSVSEPATAESATMSTSGI